MTIEQDFLPFACAGGANVLTQTAYAGLAALGPGFSAGIAPSNACNKVWRQSSIMAAMLGDFIVAQTGDTVIDDGTTATILSHFTSAVGAASGSAITAAINTAFPVTLSSPGSIKFNGGLVLKWGPFSMGSTSGSENFSVAFPNGCYGVIASAESSGGGYVAATVSSASAFSWTLGGAASGTGFYIALGH